MLLKNLFISLILGFRKSPTSTASTLAMSSATESSYKPGTYSVAYVTVPDETLGKKLATGLVENKLAACVNIIPKITSIYVWDGQVQEDNELLLMIKTRTSRVDDLTKFVRENHSYDVCEVITLPIENGNPAYLKWLGEAVSPDAQNSCGPNYDKTSC